jgi:hypothetical protein
LGIFRHIAGWAPDILLYVGWVLVEFNWILYKEQLSQGLENTCSHIFKRKKVQRNASISEITIKKKLEGILVES